MRHLFHRGGWKCVKHIPNPSGELPVSANGHRVVAECNNCGGYLALWNNYYGEPRLVHILGNLEHKCPIWFYAEADRPVPELGLLDASNKEAE